MSARPAVARSLLGCLAPRHLEEWPSPGRPPSSLWKRSTGMRLCLEARDGRRGGRVRAVEAEEATPRERQGRAGEQCGGEQACLRVALAGSNVSGSLHPLAHSANPHSRSSFGAHHRWPSLLSLPTSESALLPRSAPRGSSTRVSLILSLFLASIPFPTLKGP